MAGLAQFVEGSIAGLQVVGSIPGPDQYSGS